MNFGAGNFQIQDSWGDEKTPNNKQNNRVKTPTGRDQGIQKKESLPSILNQAGKNMVSGPTHDILDDRIANQIYKNIRKEGDNLFSQKPPNNIRKASPQNLQKKGSSNDQDLVSAMAQRLTRAETTASSYRQELKDKKEQIENMQEEISLLKKTQNSKDSLEEINRLKKENIEQKEKIVAMEKFLSEYGLKWVGNKENTGDTQNDQNEEAAKKLKDQLNNKPLYNYNLPKQIDIKLIMRRIDELNCLMEKADCQEIYQDANGYHKIRRMDPIPIGFFSDGIALKGFKFFPYKTNDAMQILADVLEGFFPYQLKKKYPKGVLLKVLDRTDIPYTVEKSKQLDIHSIDDNALKPDSKVEFLDKLPKNVIKNGKVIPIRDEIAKKLEGKKSENSQNNKEVQAIQAQQKRFDHRKDDAGAIIPLTDSQLKFDQGILTQEEISQICDLKIRTETAQYVILMKLNNTKTIRDIYNIVEHFSETHNFEIVSQLTKKAIPIDCKDNLLELDLYPNSTLNLKEIK